MENKDMNFGFRAVYLKNFRRGLATNSSSTHSLIYRNDGELFKDLDIFELDYYGRCDSTIAASREAKIKYVLAAIMFNEPLVRVMSEIYPEMKQYFPKIKDAFTEDDEYYDSDKFGMYFRGSLSFTGNLEASVDYLRNVIDNKDIVIIGGSDEMDFVYDTIAGHVKCPDPDMVDLGEKGNKFGVTKNGNYWVGYGDTRDYIVAKKNDGTEERNAIKDSFCGRIRFATSTDDIVPEYPELVDLKITNKCNNGCSFCFMDSNMQGKDADIDFLLYHVVNQFGDAEETHRHRCEFSIGGGSVILYPHLERLLKDIHQKGHIANVTIHVKDCEKIMQDENLSRIFKEYVNWIGVSLFSVGDVLVLKSFYDFFNADRNSYDNYHKHIVVHLIPEMLGVENTKRIQEAIRNEHKMWVPYLYLGFKTNGRGADVYAPPFKTDDLDKLFAGGSSYVCIDTTFANRYWDYIKDHFSTNHAVTLNEGEFSMYIDGVEKKAYKSSYQLKKPYNMDYEKRSDDNPYYDIISAFTEIRRDNGFKTYKEIERHYYDNAKHYWEE